MAEGPGSGSGSGGSRTEEQQEKVTRKRKRTVETDGSGKRFPCDWEGCDKVFSRPDHLSRWVPYISCYTHVHLFFGFRLYSQPGVRPLHSTSPLVWFRCPPFSFRGGIPSCRWWAHSALPMPAHSASAGCGVRHSRPIPPRGAAHGKQAGSWHGLAGGEGPGQKERRGGGGVR